MKKHNDQQEQKFNRTFNHRLLDGESRAKIRDEEREYLRYKEEKHLKDQIREKTQNQSRRRFLDMVTRAGVSMPLLRSSGVIAGIFSARQAAADSSTAKVVFSYASQGGSADRWFPNSPTEGNTVSRKYVEYGVAGISHFRHVNVGLPGHESARQALGDPNSSWQTQKDSYDVRIAKAIGSTSYWERIYLGARANTAVDRGEQSRLYYCSGIEDGGENVSQPAPIDGPNNALNRLFMNGKPPAMGDDSYNSVFDSQREAIKAIQKKLSAEENMRLDAHLTAVESLQKKLNGDMEGEEPFNPAACKPSIMGNFAHVRDEGKAQADILVAALACGMTRVATLQVGCNQAYFGWDPECPCASIHADGSHGGNSGAFNEIMGAQQEVAAYLLKRLTEVDDAATGEPLINSTVFASVNCMGSGQTHGPENSPWLLASKLPGFKQGFSTGNGGGCADFCSAIPVGMGIPKNLYEHIGDENKAGVLA